MKTRILMLLFSFIPFLSNAQAVEFMGLSLNVDFETFCNNLHNKGLQKTIDRFEEREYKGTFATYPNCRIIVTGTVDKKKVQSVEVVFEAVRNNEYDRDRAYNEIVRQYKNKYKSLVVEMKQDDATKLMGFEKHTIKNGTLEVHIQKFGPTIFDNKKCSMSVVYINTSVPRREKNSNYSGDI